MKILHTSDWHLGQNFMFKDRRDEHERFLEWLLGLIIRESADLLIVAGDIFDTLSPPNYALKMYYSFLGRVSAATACEVIIVGGNHDSVSTLNAPKTILEALKVHVIGGTSEDVSDEIIVVSDVSGKTVGLVCAVPFLRDRDIRKSLPGESYREKSAALIDGIKNHYAAVKDAAVIKRSHLNDKHIPIIATGHLFTEGGKVGEDENIREIYVGSLGRVSASLFPKEFDYVALGHLHRPQKVDGCCHIRYSGAPIPLSFSEAGNEKQVLCAVFGEGGAPPVITAVKIPEFQILRKARGSLDEVIKKMKAFRHDTPEGSVWVEISVIEETWQPDIERTIKELAEELLLDILAIKNLRGDRDRRLKKVHRSDTLADYTPEDVFDKRLETENGIEEDLKEELAHAFNEIRNTVSQEVEEGL